jgi:hypothetical protein
MTVRTFVTVCVIVASSPPFRPLNGASATSPSAGVLSERGGLPPTLESRALFWMDNCRRLVVRYDRHLHIYRAFYLVAIILWCIDRILK